MAGLNGTVQIDLAINSVRELNQFLHREAPAQQVRHIEILNPGGRHNLAVGLDLEATIDIRGHAGYFIAGMNKRASVTVHGNVGWSVAENIMSGIVRVKGNASQCAAASGTATTRSGRTPRPAVSSTSAPRPPRKRAASRMPRV